MRNFTAREKDILATIIQRDNNIESRNKDIDSLMEFVDLEISESKRGAAGRNRAYKEGDLDFEKRKTAIKRKGAKIYNKK